MKVTNLSKALPLFILFVPFFIGSGQDMVGKVNKKQKPIIYTAFGPIYGADTTLSSDEKEELEQSDQPIVLKNEKKEKRNLHKTTIFFFYCVLFFSGSAFLFGIISSKEIFSIEEKTRLIEAEKTLKKGFK